MDSHLLLGVRVLWGQMGSVQARRLIPRFINSMTLWQKNPIKDIWYSDGSVLGEFDTSGHPPPTPLTRKSK